MLTKTKMLMNFLPQLFISTATHNDLDIIAKNTGMLTKQEIKDGYFIDPVLGKCNLRKNLKERNKTIRSEYEAFDILHRVDGTFNKSSFKL